MPILKNANRMNLLHHFSRSPNKRMSGAMKVAGGCGSHPSLLKMQAKMVSVIKLYSIYTSIPLISLSQGCHTFFQLVFYDFMTK